MDKEHVKGAADKVVGKTKEVAGHVTGDRKLETEGKVDQAKGAVHNKVGDAKDAGKEAPQEALTRPEPLLLDAGAAPSLFRFLFTVKLLDGSNTACLNSLAPSSHFCCISDMWAPC